MVEERKIEPVHIPAAEQAEKGAVAKISSDILIHALAAQPYHHGPEIQILEQIFANHPAQEMEIVLIADLDYIGPLHAQNSAQRVYWIEVLDGVDATIVRVQGSGMRAKEIDLAMTPNLFLAIFFSRDDQPHFPLLPVCLVQQGHIEGGDSTGMRVKRVGEVKSLDRHQACIWTLFERKSRKQCRGNKKTNSITRRGMRLRSEAKECASLPTSKLLRLIKYQLNNEESTHKMAAPTMPPFRFGILVKR